jgi:hypothetical protein
VLKEDELPVSRSAITIPEKAVLEKRKQFEIPAIESSHDVLSHFETRQTCWLQGLLIEVFRSFLQPVLVNAAIVT